MKDRILGQIQNYLELGGLFNPELMEPTKVRDLLISCRDYIQDQSDARAGMIEVSELDRVLSLIQIDPHQWSHRPCDTCRQIAQIIGKPFGCLKALRNEHTS